MTKRKTTADWLITIALFSALFLLGVTVTVWITSGG